MFYSKPIFSIVRGPLLAFLGALILVSTSSAQQGLDNAAVVQIERDVIQRLIKEDLDDVIKGLKQEHPATVKDLLRHLIIYSRAAHQDDVRKTLEQLATASDWQTAAQTYAVQYRIKQSLGEDLAAWKFYYETLWPNETGDVDSFVALWEKKGDVTELDRWLAQRSSYDPHPNPLPKGEGTRGEGTRGEGTRGEGTRGKGTEGEGTINVDNAWFRARLYRRSRLGTAGELFEPMIADIKRHPGDMAIISRYLRANNYAGISQDTSWLADVCELKTAYENFQLGQSLPSASAARILEKSLSLPVTERDLELMQSGLRVQVVPLRINYEKQLRFWTKQQLAESYKNLKRTVEAQRLVGELAQMTGDDIPYRDFHQLAGEVQSMSGQRVVEREILRNEAVQQQTAKYWLERVSYYEGRAELELEKDTYVKALSAIPLSTNPRDQFERMELIRSYALFVKENNSQRPAWKSEFENWVRREFNRAARPSDYSFRLARLIADDEFELDDLRQTLLTRQPETVAQVLQTHQDWENEDQALIEDLVRSNDTTAAEKASIWTALEKLVGASGSMRAYRLGEAMFFSGDMERATPLLLGVLKDGVASDYGYKRSVLLEVVTAYCQKGDWRAAEELLTKNNDWAWASMTSGLGHVALAAAQHDSPQDATRLWRLRANLDRNDLSGLDQLAKTGARQSLLEFYLQMKKVDPSATVAESALAILK